MMDGIMPAEHANLALRASPLSGRERADLDRLETTISRGRKVFREVALALLEIHDRRLHRTTHKNFASYCREKLGYGLKYGNRLVRAAKIIQECEAKGLPPPATERQARRMRHQARETAIAEKWPGLAKTEEIEALIGKLRKLHAAHPWRARADELLTLYEETVLPWPAEELIAP